MNSRALLPIGVIALAGVGLAVSLTAENVDVTVIWAATGLAGSAMAFVGMRGANQVAKAALAVAGLAGLLVAFLVLFEWPFQGVSDPGSIFAAWAAGLIMALCGMVAFFASSIERDFPKNKSH